MKKLLFAVVALAMVGCTKSGTTPSPVTPIACAAEDTILTAVSTGVATQLACSDTAAVKATLSADAAKLDFWTKICPAQPAVQGAVKVQGVVGDVVCQPLTDALMTGVLAQIPAAWKCTGGLPADKLKAAVLAACQKAL